MYYMGSITYLLIVYFQIGSTALFHACLRGHIKAAKRLICDPRINLRLLRVSLLKTFLLIQCRYSACFFHAQRGGCSKAKFFNEPFLLYVQLLVAREKKIGF